MKTYTFELLATVRVTYSFSESEVLQEPGGGEDEVVPTDAALGELEQSLLETLGQNYAVEAVGIDVSSDDLQGVSVDDDTSVEGSASGESFGDLFDPEPLRWGLRGDPYLWREMRVHLSMTALPSTPEELCNAIAEAFKELTGNSFEQMTDFAVSRFAHGGMSSGGICPAFWHRTAVPLLLARLEQRRSDA